MALYRAIRRGSRRVPGEKHGGPCASERAPPLWVACATRLPIDRVPLAGGTHERKTQELKPNSAGSQISAG
eukprot:1939050-Alexandrium_andersonii.AAC.1